MKETFKMEDMNRNYEITQASEELKRSLLSLHSKVHASGKHDLIIAIDDLKLSWQIFERILIKEGLGG